VFMASARVRNVGCFSRSVTERSDGWILLAIAGVDDGRIHPLRSSRSWPPVLLSGGGGRGDAALVGVLPDLGCWSNGGLLLAGAGDATTGSAVTIPYRWHASIGGARDGAHAPTNTRPGAAVPALAGHMAPPGGSHEGPGGLPHHNPRRQAKAQEATHNGDPTSWSAMRSAEGGHDAVA
jgi:hypothetical protein